jgi:hypothetical protein
MMHNLPTLAQLEGISSCSSDKNTYFLVSKQISSMNPMLRQGDVLIIPSDTEFTGTKLSHLTLAEGEVTGHRHRISNGEAELFESEGVLYLKILSPTAILSHEEHAQVTIPQGNWEIRIQREYSPEGLRYVVD